MAKHDLKQIAAIRETDGSIKCANCMDKKDWDQVEETGPGQQGGTAIRCQDPGTACPHR